MKRGATLFLFLLGVFCETRVYLLGALALSEFVVMPLAIVLVVLDWKEMRRCGFVTFIYMGLLLTVFMLMSAYINESRLWLVIKKLASIYGKFAWFVVFYHYLKNNYRGLGFFFLGAGISSLITIFAFNPSVGVDGVIQHSTELEDMLQGQLFWFGRFTALGQLPMIMAYLKTPMIYIIAAPIALTAFLLLTTVSGRSGSLIILLASLIMVMVGKSRTRMKWFGSHLVMFLVLSFLLIVAYKIVYTYGARTGLFGEETQIKYEHQGGDSKGASIIRLLMSGRKEFFMAIPAIMEHPIIGHGIGSVDRTGVQEEFLRKYGSDYDYQYYLSLRRLLISRGASGNMGLIAHSHIMGAWLRYGIGGLLFYCYILWLMYMHVRHYLSAIPQWCGYFALIIPHYAWHIFFSPPSDRWQFALMVVCILFARAIAKGKLVLPYDMEQEAKKYDNA